MTIVTKESMKQALANDNPEFVKRYIGRALVALFNRRIYIIYDGSRRLLFDKFYLTLGL